MTRRQKSELTVRARELRARQTEAESLLWYILRGRRLCGLKFRRQFPIEPFIVDFACIERRVVIEIDGGYHDYVYEKDQSRQQRIEEAGWRVFRLTNEEVLEDIEAVATAITRGLDIEGTPSPQPSPPKY
jgi:very-short-patch-repair endonuclease